MKYRPRNMTLEEVYTYYTHPSMYTLYFEQGCWLSKVKTKNKGYPTIRWNNSRPFLHRLILAHKIGRMLTKDEKTSHLCHNGAIGCINPAHLEVDDDAGNMAYRNAAGRQARGEKQGNALLTDDDVFIIRSHYIPQGYNNKQIAAIYGVKPRTIKSIRYNDSWKHIKEAA